MPRFDFQCEECQHVFEAMIPFGSKKFPKCPTCHGSVQKQIAPPMGIHFKGSGFYKTDSVTPKKESTEPKKKKDGTGESSNAQKPSEASPKSPAIDDSSSNGEKVKNEKKIDKK